MFSRFSLWSVRLFWRRLRSRKKAPPLAIAFLITVSASTSYAAGEEIAKLFVVYEDKKMYADAITQYRTALQLGGPPREMRGFLGYVYAAIPISRLNRRKKFRSTVSCCQSYTLPLQFIPK